MKTNESGKDGAQKKTSIAEPAAQVGDAKARSAAGKPRRAILPSNEKSFAVSYLALRQMIGVLGTSLPFIVSIGALAFFGQTLQPSISAYYYTGMRDVMVGMLTATGLFLFSYKGYSRADALAGKVACVFALGVAYFPTAPADPTPWQNVVSNLHLFFAAGFFLTLSYFCLFLFVKTNPSGYPPMTVRKMYRNSVYRVCGGVMVVCMALMAAYNFAGGDATGLARFHPTFWLETYAILAFGISWLTKGEAILKDEE